jgi:hypothetical protein
MRGYNPARASGMLSSGNMEETSVGVLPKGSALELPAVAASLCRGAALDILSHPSTAAQRRGNNKTFGEKQTRNVQRAIRCNDVTFVALLT